MNVPDFNLPFRKDLATGNKVSDIADPLTTSQRFISSPQVSSNPTPSVILHVVEDNNGKDTSTRDGGKADEDEDNGATMDSINKDR